jgi:hypothetical protein
VNAKWVTNDKYPPQESLLFVECSIFLLLKDLTFFAGENIPPK